MIECEQDLQPLAAETTGCELPFTRNGRQYQLAACEGVVRALGTLEFTGVCECFLRFGYKPGLFYLGVAAGPTGDQSVAWWGEASGRPPTGWWRDFVNAVASYCGEGANASLNRGWCASNSALGLRAGMQHLGTAGFEDGMAVWESAPSGMRGSPFIKTCRSHNRNAEPGAPADDGA